MRPIKCNSQINFSSWKLSLHSNLQDSLQSHLLLGTAHFSTANFHNAVAQIHRVAQTSNQRGLGSLRVLVCESPRVFSRVSTQFVYTFGKTLQIGPLEAVTSEYEKALIRLYLRVGQRKGNVILKQSVDMYSWVYWCHSSQVTGLKTWADSSVCVTRLWAGLLHGNKLANICISVFL